jgi:hypothetical protein
MEDRIKQLENEVKYLKEMINLIVDFNGKQIGINKDVNYAINILKKLTK